MASKITLHEMSPEEFEELIRRIMQDEIDKASVGLQRAFGEDDLISSGTACRLLGVCKKQLKYMVDEGLFTVHMHLKERRFKRGEILDFVNKYRIKKKRG